MSFKTYTIEQLIKQRSQPDFQNVSICDYNYQMTKPYIKNFRTGIDIGCKIGNYTRPMLEDFQKVYGFDMRNKNRIKNKKFDFICCAVGDIDKQVSYKGAVIDNHFTKTNKLIKQRTLDSFNFQHVDHIKIDVEGHELRVLQGSKKTLGKWKPVILIEQNQIVEKHSKGKMYDAVNFLLEQDYQLVDYNGTIDFVLVHKDTNF